MNLTEWPLLVVADHHKDEFEKERLGELIQQLKKDNITVIPSINIEHIVDLCASQRDISGVLIDINMNASRASILEAVVALRKRFPRLNIFILAEKSSAEELPTEILESTNGFYWLDDDTVTFMAGRLSHLIKEYAESNYGPFFKGLVNYVNEYKYAWHTPGHMGGEGFKKSPAGTALYNFFGENTLRSDLSISVPDLGSLLDHSGPIGDSEKFASDTFNSDQTYYILNGTSTVNQVIWRSQVSRDDLALVDRNCHKSLNYAMVITNAKPMYMMPRRNALGIIGPVKMTEMTEMTSLHKKSASPIISEEELGKDIVMSALTNSTYDGLAYNVRKVKKELGNHVNYIHFDEAWYAYARFHPIYDGFYGMTPDENKEHPPVFTSHSTHKLLNAFSQGSMLHIKNGDKETIVPDEFNEAYMMHASTSPNYPMIASLDVSTKMMHDNGVQMSHDNILDAIELRQKMVRIQKEFLQKGEWFFGMWQPTEYKGEAFDSVSKNTLAENQDAWVLQPNAKWHGFEDLEEDFILLDPIKLTFTTPGVEADGTYTENGIPAGIVADYLMNKGIVTEKTDTYSFLMLHSFGTSKGKQGELLSALLNFKKDYDNNTSLEVVFPNLLEESDKYQGMGLKDLCDAMHHFYKENNFLAEMQKAFENLPEQTMKPADAYEQVVRKNVEYTYLEDMMNKIPAVMIVPYPPGIPVMMGGEILNDASKAVYNYLSILEKYENTFPGYEKDIHGVERDIVDGKIKYKTLCIKETNLGE
ncbi:Orn/Lys/Arg decarboxylase N-terminal domain-containing protein [Flammeovirga sp. SubArs3]|uniref:Orn/Lys/Arg family decarboxylase n=1 Tax=Flammeovirga sp. SubArs3 TaxID=2995316 RepID=UPI00248CC941|nr:Orn/Lys/Arg decarboxylase N-terminal domain-containing protein [Flammeovirga sp. SubArs3]